VIPVAFTLIDDVQQFFARLIPSSKQAKIKDSLKDGLKGG